MQKSNDKSTLSNWAIGIDIGGTKTKVAQVDSKGIVHDSIQFPTQLEVSVLEAEIVKTIQMLKKNTKSPLIGIGIGMAGQIAPNTGVVYFAPNLNWHHVPLQSDLQKALNCPVVVTNDVRAITWGEWHHGAGRNCQDFVCLFIGTGIGGGIVSNGQLLSGASNTAGELGHMTIDLKGRPCTCGNTGCLETIAGGWGIAQRAQEAVTSNPEKGTKLLEIAGGRHEAITAEVVAHAYNAGDPLAKKIAEETASALIAGTVSIVHVLNPQRLILGGGVIQGMPWLIQSVEKGIRQHALAASCQSLEVISAQLHTDGGVIGAGSLALHQFSK